VRSRSRRSRVGRAGRVVDDPHGRRFDERMYLRDTLLACPACGCHARSSETECPQCGARLRNDDGSRTRTAGAALLGLLLVGGPSLAAAQLDAGCATAPSTGAGGEGGAYGTGITDTADYGCPATCSTAGAGTGTGGGGGQDGAPASTSASSSSGGHGGASASTNASTSSGGLGGADAGVPPDAPED
jgi:hypothetical protein